MPYSIFCLQILSYYYGTSSSERNPNSIQKEQVDHLSTFYVLHNGFVM